MDEKKVALATEFFSWFTKILHPTSTKITLSDWQWIENVFCFYHIRQARDFSHDDGKKIPAVPDKIGYHSVQNWFDFLIRLNDERKLLKIQRCKILSLDVINEIKQYMDMYLEMMPNVQRDKDNAKLSPPDLIAVCFTCKEPVYNSVHCDFCGCGTFHSHCPTTSCCIKKRVIT